MYGKKKNEMTPEKHQAFIEMYAENEKRVSEFAAKMTPKDIENDLQKSEDDLMKALTKGCNLN